MALQKAPMKAVFQAVFSKFNPSHVITATEVAGAITLYWLTGLHPTGGVVIPAAAQPIIFAGLVDAWNPFPPATSIVAGKVADAVHAGLLSVIIAGGLFGVGGVASADKGLLKTRIMDAYDPHPPTGADHGSKLADAIEAYTKTNEVFGTGVPPASGPPQGSFV